MNKILMNVMRAESFTTEGYKERLSARNILVMYPT
jgi:hypothetical protein